MTGMEHFCVYTDENPSDRLIWSLIVRKENSEPTITSGVFDWPRFFATRIKLLLEERNTYYILLVDEINNKALVLFMNNTTSVVTKYTIKDFGAGDIIQIFKDTSNKEAIVLVYTTSSRKEIRARVLAKFSDFPKAGYKLKIDVKNNMIIKSIVCKEIGGDKAEKVCVAI